MTGNEFWLSKESHNGEGHSGRMALSGYAKSLSKAKKLMNYSNLHKEVS